MTLSVEEIERQIVAGDKRLAQRIYNETPFWSEHFSHIVNHESQLVPFLPNRAQRKVDTALDEQDAAGRAMRIIILKARRTGASTWNINKLVHRLTLRPNRRGLVVAQNNATASEIFGYAEVIYDNLPNTGGPLSQWIKPPTVNRRSSTGGEKYIHWGEPARDARARGQRGLDSRLQIDTASESSGGRGMRITDLLCSEVAHWPDDGEKALALMSTVPDAHGTLIVEESTANGMNQFHTSWNNAVSGKSGYAPVFLSWLDDPNYRRAFADSEEKKAFVKEEFGKGPEGADEERLMEVMLGDEFSMTEKEAWERLWWRRAAIFNRAKGDLSKFKQEYPSTPLEAFVGSGRHVFSVSFIEKAEEEAKLWNPPPLDPAADREDPQPGDGLLVASGWKERTLHFGGTFEIPTGALWVPETIDTDPDKPRWRVWHHPKHGEDYIVAVDVAAGDEMTTTGDSDFHAIQVVDHRTGEQVAEWRSRIDRDLLGMEAVLIGLYFNTALLAVEITGGYGLGLAEDLFKKYAYRRLYKRRLIAQTRDRPQRQIGFDTTRKTKPRMEDNLGELLRDGAASPEQQVIRSLNLVNELKTYVRFDSGRHGADVDQHDDLLMAFMIAQRIRDLERPPITSGSTTQAPRATRTPNGPKRYG